MNISIKLITLWIASLALFTGAGIAILAASDWMSGVHGLAIRFFLGYCSIIVVTQVCAFMKVIRRRPEDSAEKSCHYHTGMESA
jgi:hypothetical protein